MKTVGVIIKTEGVTFVGGLWAIQGRGKLLWINR